MFGVPPRRLVRTFAAIAVSAAIVIGPLGSSPAGAETLRHRMLNLINHARTRAGLHTLKLDRGLSTKASRHTRAMIRRNELFHTADVTHLLAGDHWTVFGENVGCAGTVFRLHRDFMHSPDHRANILRRGFRHVGLGVIRTADGALCGPGNRVWATEDFWG